MFYLEIGVSHSNKLLGNLSATGTGLPAIAILYRYRDSSIIYSAIFVRYGNDFARPSLPGTGTTLPSITYRDSVASYRDQFRKLQRRLCHLQGGLYKGQLRKLHG
jgi:hypothetical protein